MNQTLTEQHLRRQLFTTPPENFEQLALEVFHYQARHCAVYRQFLSYYQTDISRIQQITAIPFMPVEVFRHHTVISDGKVPQLVFESSTTTGDIPAKHAVADRDIYHESLLKGFSSRYGHPSQYAMLALLPSYLERGHSSLVHMVQQLMEASAHPANGFYLYDHEALALQLAALENKGQPTLLIGVTYALLDFAAQYPMPLKHTIVMETGGMKGRRKEMIREEVHQQLTAAFGVPEIHSEYGMTELLSQAYSTGSGRYTTPPWMRVLVRDAYDPMDYLPTGSTGQLNIIDLANLYSCSFLSTSDLGQLHADGTFSVIGRQDISQVRGCNLMML